MVINFEGLGQGTVGQAGVGLPEGLLTPLAQRPGRPFPATQLLHPVEIGKVLEISIVVARVYRHHYHQSNFVDSQTDILDTG